MHFNRHLHKDCKVLLKSLSSPCNMMCSMQAFLRPRGSDSDEGYLCPHSYNFTLHTHIQTSTSVVYETMNHFSTKCFDAKKREFF